jgi:hypothetical protein
MFGLAVAAVGAIVSVTVALRIEVSGVALGLTLLFVGACAGFARVLWQEHKFQDLLPSWLDEHFRDGPMFEDDGVQWVFARGNGPETAPDVEVFLQNNIDAVRIVEVTLRDEAGFLLRQGALVVPDLPEIELQPRARATATIPCRWEPSRNSKKVRLYCVLRAKGPPGPRNRKQRASAGPVPTPKWLAFLAPLGGVFIWRRGGVFLTLYRPASVEPSSVPVVANVRTFPSG